MQRFVLRQLPFFLLALVFVLVPSACVEDDTTNDVSNGVSSSDATAFLEAIANDFDDRYEAWIDEVQALKVVLVEVRERPSEVSLLEAQTALREAYSTWQSVSPFVTGPGEGFRFRERVNTYPCDTDLVLSNAMSGNDTNLDLPSNTAAQGLPALDFLLHGVEQGNDQLLLRYAQQPELLDYAVQVATSLINQATNVNDSWKADKANFIAATSNSATGSINRFANDFVFYYEKALRAGKLGIPAGVFSNDIRPDLIERKYASAQSRDLLVSAIDNFQKIFNGTITTNDPAASSLAGLISTLEGEREEALAPRINSALSAASAAVKQLDADLSENISRDQNQVLLAYDQLQAVVPLLKIEMMQILNVSVDYVDADGD